MDRSAEAMLDLITWHAPAAFLAALGAARLSLHEIHHGLLTLAASRALMRFIVELLKNAVGRLRPDFFARCRFSLLEQVCTGAEAVVREGRRSFPSGHSSTSAQAMVILALVLAGKLRAFAWRGRAGRGGSSFAALTISLSPIPVALWVAVTRLEDNRHHPTDGAFTTSRAVAGSDTVSQCSRASRSAPLSRSLSTQSTGPRRLRRPTCAP